MQRVSNNGLFISVNAVYSKLFNCSYIPPDYPYRFAKMRKAINLLIFLPMAYFTPFDPSKRFSQIYRFGGAVGTFAKMPFTVPKIPVDNQALTNWH